MYNCSSPRQFECYNSQDKVYRKIQNNMPAKICVLIVKTTIREKLPRNICAFEEPPDVLDYQAKFSA